MKRIVVVAALAVALPVFAADPKPIKKQETITLKTKIEAIDHTGRTITVKGKDGKLQTLYVEPEIKRFDELNVGDTISFKYTEGIAVKVRKPGEKAAAASTGEPTITRGTGPKPSGTVTREMTGTVLVKAVNQGSGALTFMAEDGHTVSVKVEDKKLLKGVKPGDHIEVTYSNALVVSVE